MASTQTWGGGGGGASGLAGSAFGALGSLGMGAAGSAIGGAISSAFQKKQQRYAYKVWRKQTLKGPTFQMKGLRDAGINPILVAGGGLKAGGNIPMQMQRADVRPVASAREGREQSLLGLQRNLLKEQIAQTRHSAGEAFWKENLAHIDAKWQQIIRGIDQDLFINRDGSPTTEGKTYRRLQHANPAINSAASLLKQIIPRR